MEGKDNIKELFSQKLGNYEAKVNPELWAKISTQVAAGATTTVATGLSVFAKVAIGLGISAAAITTVVLLSTSSEETVTENPTIEVQQETPTSTSPDEKEQVAELTEQKESDKVAFRDVREYLVTQTQTTNPVSSASDTQKDKDPEISVDGMKMKGATSVTTGGTSEPTIVEGVRYSETTNYGGSTVDPDPEVVVETPTPKVEPIKRFVNVFTPNGQNPEFFLESEGLTDFTVIVFNPNGDIVFQSDDPNFRWDGRDMRTGEVVESGNYMYMVTAYDSERNPYPIYERLTVIVN